jgi:hypothetical protein
MQTFERTTRQSGGSEPLGSVAAVAERYVPTEAEAKVLARQARRRSRLPPTPPVTVVSERNESGERVAVLKIEHADKTGKILDSLLAAAIAVDDPRFLHGVLNGLINASQSDGQISNDLFNMSFAFVAGIQPRDHVEVLLTSQMAAIHIATMEMATRLAASKNHEMRIASEKAVNRLARTFAAQVEALKRYRSKGEQRVYVERVNVEKGGQAIVGPVSHQGGGGGDDDESER